MLNRKGTITAIVLILLVAVGLLGLMCFSMATENVPLPFSIMARPAELVNRQTVSLAEIENIEVLYHSDDMELCKSEGGDLILEEYMNRKDESLLAKLSQEAGTLKIEGPVRNTSFSFLHSFQFCSHIKIYLPPAYADALKIETGSGDIQCREDLALSNLSLRSKSGDIHAGTISAGKDIAIETSSGELMIGGGLKAETISVETGSGDIVIENAAAAEKGCSAKTSSGSIRMESLKAENAELSTRSGDIHIDMELEAKKLAVTASSGDTTICNAAGVVDITSQSGFIRVLGDSWNGKLSSASGDITLQTNTLAADITVESKSGDVWLTVPDRAAFRFHAKTQSGDINTNFDDELSFDKRGDTADGTVGEGIPHNISITTSSGSITTKH